MRKFDQAPKSRVQQEPIDGDLQQSKRDPFYEKMDRIRNRQVQEFIEDPRKTREAQRGFGVEELSGDSRRAAA